MTVVRLWRAGVDGTRASEYEVFAETRSRPMFERQDGFEGVLFTRRDEDVLVITLWRDQQAVAALADSACYQETVRAIGETGFLRGTSSVETYELHGGFIGWVGCSG
jgi:heme-degrading monooxygenase HmoA